MKKRPILFAGVAFLAFAPWTNCQSLTEGLKQLDQRVGQQIEKIVGQKAVKIAATQPEKTVDNVIGTTVPNTQTNNDSSGKQFFTQGEKLFPGARLPKEHTALFAPLGYDVDASFGVKSVKPVLPPMAATKQVDWVDKMPCIFELDNQSVVDEYLLLSQCKEDGYIEPLTPADSRYYVIMGELGARTNELNSMAGYYNELLEEYDSDVPQWVIEGIEGRLASVLGGECYKRTIRSSLAPLFKLKANFIEEKTREYFAAHGGYENAHKEKLTVWDPKPDKPGITTSVPGQTGVVVDEVKAGATVDIDGVQYVLHYAQGGKGGWAFASEAVKTAVAGKDIVIPAYINYNGHKFSVKSMRGELFYATTIRSVKIPNTMTELPNAAFRGTPITEIVIPASVKSLKGSVFQDCTKLEKVTFEGDYMEEFSGSFRNCTSLVSIVCPRRVDRISYDMFAGCVNLTEVILPENLTGIPSGTFEDCRKLKKIDIPLTVTKIGNMAFGNCAVTELDLRNVTEFEGFCFSGCKALKKVVLSSKLKDDFLMETYEVFMECPLLQVKYVNNSYVYPEGFVFVP